MSRSLQRKARAKPDAPATEARSRWTDWDRAPERVMHGLFKLRTGSDLLAKLEHDYARLKESPGDTYAAFDFFVTAEHMLDWLYPGRDGKQARSRQRSREVLLRVVSHLATGAKHTRPEDPRHDSVQHADVATPARFGVARSGATRSGGAGGLVIDLEGDASEELGPTITALALAERVLMFWRTYDGLKTLRGGDP